MPAWFCLWHARPRRKCRAPHPPQKRRPAYPQHQRLRAVNLPRFWNPRSLLGRSKVICSPMVSCRRCCFLKRYMSMQMQRSSGASLGKAVNSRRKRKVRTVRSFNLSGSSITKVPLGNARVKNGERGLTSLHPAAGRSQSPTGKPQARSH